MIYTHSFIHSFSRRDFQVVCLLSSTDLGHLLELMPEGINLDFVATVIKQKEESVEALAKRIKEAVGTR